MVLVYSKMFKKHIYVMVLQNFKNNYGKYQIRCILSENSTDKIKIEYEEESNNLNKNNGVSNSKYYRYFDPYYTDIIDIMDFKIKIDEKRLLTFDQNGYAFISVK